MLSWIAEYIGYGVGIYFFYHFLLWVYNNFLYKSSKIKKLAEGHNKWAVVTGPTSGIGEGFAIELAKKQFNLILVGRSKEKLSILSENLEKTYGIQTKSVIFDFSKPDTSEELQNYSKTIESLSIAVLVNNVGINTEQPEFFLDVDPLVYENMINVNCKGCVDITQKTLPKMLEAKSGVIFNLSSYTAEFTSPLNAVYAGTKAFMNSWSLALKSEYESKGVEILSLLPMYVKSNMTKFKKTSFSVYSGEEFARKSLNCVGNPMLPYEVSPCLTHSLTMAMFRFLPIGILNYFTKSVMISTSKKMKAKKATATEQK